MRLKQALKSTLPASVFHLVRDFPWMMRGAYAKAPKEQGPIPPLRLMFDGPRDFNLFLRAGQETLVLYKTLAGMRPTDAVLDIGCGIGRKTIPLLDYLESKALYVGMDIDRRGIDWLLRNVTSINPRFVFLQLDIFNKYYNPKGALIPDKLVLPFPDASFDLVALWSVFTHMYPADVKHYLAEIARVLKPGGTLTASYYLFNDDILKRMNSNETQINFAYELKDCRTINPNIPEDAIALDDRWLRDAQAEFDLKMTSLMYGAWSGHSPHPSLAITNHQDIVISKKGDSYPG